MNKMRAMMDRVLKEFKDFAMRGNVVDMAVGIIVGGAFGTIVKSLVSDILMPPFGLLLGGIDFSNSFIVLKHGVPPGPYTVLAEAQTAGAVTINYGVFVDNIISFLIVAIAVFMLIKGLNKLQREVDEASTEPTTRPCPFCVSTVSIQATRCPYCTSDLTPAGSPQTGDTAANV